MEATFWISLAIIFYAFLGYGIIILIITKIKRLLSKAPQLDTETALPSVTFVVPCYNELDMIDQKIQNCLALDYPKEKYEIIFITDGSTDGTPDAVKKYPEIKLLHDDIRGGKSSAENRAMKYVNSEITIFSDANTVLPTNALKKMMRHYANPKVGAVSGEKRIQTKSSDKAVGAGEGIYWKYESFLKKLDSELNTIVGAAGELISFRTSLFEHVEKDTILDDFMLSMRIAAKGFRVIYEPEAYALETASASIKEELKRKIRICAGGWQAMSRLLPILWPFPNPVLTFQYISHRVLRWSIVPVLLIVVFITNYYLALNSSLYMIIFNLQIIFYLGALLGYLLEKYNIKLKVLFIPYYFSIMNYSVIMGFIRFLKGSQSAAWERSQRSK